MSVVKGLSAERSTIKGVEPGLSAERSTIKGVEPYLGQRMI